MFLREKEIIAWYIILYVSLKVLTQLILLFLQKFYLMQDISTVFNDMQKRSKSIYNFKLVM